MLYCFVFLYLAAAGGGPWSVRLRRRARSAQISRRMTDDPTRNIALLIDADNASAAALDPVLTVLAELGTVNVRRVYGNWSKPALKGWRDMTVKHGIEPQQQFDLTKGKNATDMKMTIDAMDLLFRGRIDGFGIMSSDSDFMPLAMRIRQDGVPVYGFGTSQDARGVPTGLHALHRRRRAGRRVEAAADARCRRRSATRRAAPKPAAAPRPKAKLAIDAERHQAADRRLSTPSSATRAAMSACRRWASSPATGRASTRATMAIKRLSDLIEAVPNFQTERREDGAGRSSSGCGSLTSGGFRIVAERRWRRTAFPRQVHACGSRITTLLGAMPMRFDDRRTELIEGDVHRHGAGISVTHAYVRDKLTYSLQRRLGVDRVGCCIPPGGSVVHAPTTTMPQPDIVLTANPRGPGAIPLGFGHADRSKMSATTLERRHRAATQSSMPATDVAEYWVVDVNARDHPPDVRTSDDRIRPVTAPSRSVAPITAYDDCRPSRSRRTCLLAELQCIETPRARPNRPSRIWL